MSLLSNHVYRGAIALNNIGVDLLERRCYEQALVTLLDATAAMKTALKDMRNTSVIPTDNMYVTEMVERANKRRSRPSYMERQPPYDMLDHADNYRHHLLQQDEHDQLLKTVYPIRIDDVNSDCRCPSNLSDPDAQGAIVLYNCALANLCLARAAYHEDVRETKLNHAAYLFEMSNSILEQRNENTEDEVTLRQLACMNVAILSGLLRTLFYESGVYTEQTKTLSARLFTMRSTIEYLDDYLYEYTAGVQSASAA
jgi:hypothetical protein